MDMALCEYDGTSSIITLDFSQFDQSNDCEIWVKTLAKTTSVEVIEHNIGADREQVLFKFENQLYLLQVEYLSESVWIEGVHGTGSATMRDLYDILQAT